MSKHYSSSYPKYEVISNKRAKINGRDFLVQSRKIQDDPETEYYQKTFSDQYGKHVLEILVNYYNGKELEENMKLLNSIQWY